MADGEKDRVRDVAKRLVVEGFDSSDGSDDEESSKDLDGKVSEGHNGLAKMTQNCSPISKNFSTPSPAKERN